MLDLDLGSVWRDAEVLYYLIWRNVKVRYKQTVFGVAWVVLQPLLGSLVFTVIFGHFVRVPSDGLPYPVFVYCALVPWSFFAAAVTRSIGSVVTDAELVSKVYFPRLILPLAAIISTLLDFAVSLGLLFGLMLLYGITPGAAVLTIPVFVLLAVLTALALALWLAPANVRFRDVSHAVPFLLQVWMFASPVVYPVSVVPERWRSLYALNPMAGVIEGFRWALLGNQSPDLRVMAISGAVVVLLVVSGLIWFKRMERTFVDTI